ncbi:MAG: efflux RND transporter permease subunit, partial [Myxococcales bacterium]|nr:efflux RND transporter permease subunit [Myxococcales bacterium]
MNPARARKLQRRGPIAWMAKNSVAANLMMGVLLLGGFFMVGQVKQEVFPEFTLDLVNVSVPYPGASPEEVEQGIVTVIEEAVRGLDGVDKVTSRALESVASINIELIDGTDGNKALSDIKAAVDRIVSFPEDAEEPVTSLFLARNKVISLVVYGDQDEESLRQLIEKARDEVLQSEAVTQVELVGVRSREIAVEIAQADLRAHGLTLSAVAEAMRRASIDLPAGSVKSDAGETLLRTRERRDYGSEFADVAIKSARGGAVLRVRDLAKVRDAFADEDLKATYNGKTAVQVDVYRVGAQTPIAVAAAVNEYAKAFAATLPPGVQVDTWNDSSEILADRIDLLMRNAKMGLVLVFLALALFLEFKLAFWVMLGIPISFMGAFLLMPVMDVSVNMISLFAFIVTLGIVVDDAIVVGENVYELREKGIPPLEAAIAGSKQVAVPVVFAVLTTVAAFSPLFFVPGVSGKFMRNIPAIVVSVILFSLVESLFILPAHLAHSKKSENPWIRRLMAGPEFFRRLFSGGLQRFIYEIYQPLLRFMARNRYLALSGAMALLIATVGTVAGGHVEFTFMPKVEGDLVTASARLPEGVPIEETVKVRDRLIASVRTILEEAGGEAKLSRGIYASVGQAIAQGNRPSAGAIGGGSHIVDVAVRLVPAGDRDIR